MVASSSTMPMARRISARAAGALFLIVFGAASAAANGLAFPGADGFGARATGWQGGEIETVTSLDDSGPGTLRDCADNGDAPRICVFAVGGTIIVRSPIRTGSNLYIAGQTAPGDGVQIRLDDEGKRTPLVIKNVHDVVVRHLKLRPGRGREPSANIDAVTVENSERIYLGNLSMAFASDETFNIHVSGATARDITLADSILALSLDRAGHPDGRHSKGALMCSNEGDGSRCGRISLLRNLFAHHRDRNPDVKGTDIGPIEVVNNVFYDPISQFGEFYDLLGDAEILYVGNVALVGPSTISETPEAVQVFEWEDGARIRLFAKDNATGAGFGCTSRSGAVLSPDAEAAQDPSLGGSLTVTPIALSNVVSAVLGEAGDRIPGRRPADALDLRVLGDLQTCGGRVIDDPEEVGGWPVLSDAPAAESTDSDGDGLPDAWEASRPNLDPGRPDDPWSRDADTGLSIVETWLAALAGDGARS